MDAVTAKELASALSLFVTSVDKVGVEGIIVLVFGSPLLMVIIFGLQTVLTGRRLHSMFEEARKCLNDLWEKHREETTRLQETHRQETAAIVRELGEGLGRTTRYYEDNVKLVEDYSKLAHSLQDLIVTNIRTIEKVAAGIETLCKTMGAK